MEQLTTGNPSGKGLSDLFQPGWLFPKSVNPPPAWLLTGCLLFVPACARAQQAASSATCARNTTCRHGESASSSHKEPPARADRQAKA